MSDLTRLGNGSMNSNREAFNKKNCNYMFYFRHCNSIATRFHGSLQVFNPWFHGSDVLFSFAIRPSIATWSSRLPDYSWEWNGTNVWNTIA